MTDSDDWGSRATASRIWPYHNFTIFVMAPERDQTLDEEKWINLAVSCGVLVANGAHTRGIRQTCEKTPFKWYVLARQWHSDRFLTYPLNP